MSRLQRLIPCLYTPGSGKTTLLNHLISSVPAGLRIGVMVNEFGSIDIDSSLVESTSTIDSGTIELSNGCICCTINESLLQTLTQLVERRGRLDCLVLETSGVADPRPIIDTIRLPSLAGAIRLDAVVTVVDASRLVEQMRTGPALVERSLEDSAWGRSANAATVPVSVSAGVAPAGADAGAPLALPATIKAQLAFADVVVLNKADLVSATQLLAAESSLNRLLGVEGLQFIHARHGRVPHELLLGHLPQLQTDGAEDASAPLAPRAKLDAAGARPAPPAIGGAGSSHLGRDAFRSVAYRGARPLSLQSFEALRTGDEWASVIRAKGFLRLSECEGYWLTLQMCGARLDVRATTARPGARRLALRTSAAGPGGGEGAAATAAVSAVAVAASANAAAEGAAPASDCGSELVLIGVRGMEPKRLLHLLRGCEAAPAANDGAEDEPLEMGWGVCEDPADVEAAGAAAESAELFAKLARRDPRFDVLWVRAGVVAFRMLAWFSTSAETLNAELLDETNAATTGSGRTWVAPTRGELRADDTAPGELTLLHASGPHTRAKLCWVDVQAAAERVMTRHLGGFVCGSCDCLEDLAGQVLV